MKLTGSFVSVASLISGDLVVFVRFNLFFNSVVWVLVYILINVTNFLRNERFVYIFDSEKTLPILGKNKVCILSATIRRMWQREGTLKQLSFTCIKENCHGGVRGEERYNHQQSFTNFI